MRARAPGKLILSGEHAVVYGRPAVISAVTKYANAQAEPADEFIVRIPFSNHVFHGSQEELLQRCQMLDKRLSQFESGNLPVEQITQDDADLFVYAVGAVLKMAAPSVYGIDVSVEFDMPVGCGMGASGAGIASVAALSAALWGQALSREELYAISLSAERLQHGRPSGADPYTSIFGGLLRFQSGNATGVKTSGENIWTLVHTGISSSTTGQCVSRVASHFGDSSDPIWAEFEAVTQRVEHALVNDDASALLSAVRDNHRLLSTIGVVPAHVQNVVSEIEHEGGAAKICGAGSVQGDAAGLMWVCGDVDIHAVCAHYGYDVIEVCGDGDGTICL